ncbi:hypothetical protein [Amphibacillus jilinensis]|uniref:hypothetical protein n=1 Tax=Amphibacillus jilinensis TaxID=1216008 RepID=UPI00031D4907|nr:hypothetical protein [Amphibacillus jilinensis]
MSNKTIYKGTTFDLTRIAQLTTSEIAEIVSQVKEDHSYSLSPFTGYIVSKTERAVSDVIGVSIVTLACTFHFAFQSDRQQGYRLEEKHFLINYDIEQLAEHIKMFRAAYYSTEKYG